MAKFALLIGVSEYEPGLDGLPSAVNDVIAVQQVLINPNMGEFADTAVTVLQNPDRQAMEDAIYNLFANRQRDDLVLLYFSGHGVVDDRGEFFFANCLTRKQQGRLVPTTATAARSIHDWMEGSRSQRKVIILDSCFSGAFAQGVKAKDGGSINPSHFLGGRGTAILTASTSTQYALTQNGFDLSVYTHYLVEGIRTGGADQDNDGFIGMEELHTYASSKVREAAPAMTPEFYPVREGYNILLAKSPKDDRKLRYRKEVKQFAEEEGAKFSFVTRAYLEDLQRKLKLLPKDATEIEAEELEPYRQRRKKVDRYQTVFEGAIAKQYPLTKRDRLGLQRLQELLSLRDEDVKEIESPLLVSKQTEYERQQAQQNRQRQEATEELREQAPKLPQDSERVEQRQAEPILSPKLSRNSASSRAAQVSLKRRQLLKWGGFGGGGLVVAVIGNEILKNQQSQPTQSISPPTQLTQPVSVAAPKITAPGPGSAKMNGLPLWTVEFETVLVNGRAEVTQRPVYQAKFIKVPLNKVELELVSIPAGSFQMGSPSTEAESSDDERPQHLITLKSFLMGKYPVTQAQWKAVASSMPQVKIPLNPAPSSFKGENLPVETVSWEQAQEFCARLSQKTKHKYRLPSEAEWEYACRGGTKTPFHFGETITPELANYNGGYTYGQEPKGKDRGKTTKVGDFKVANAYGLYDMHGNVWEWCEDPWHDSYMGSPSDGSAWITGGDASRRILRGGSWFNIPRWCRSALRFNDTPGFRLNVIGFRVVCEAARTL